MMPCCNVIRNGFEITLHLNQKCNEITERTSRLRRQQVKI